MRKRNRNRKIALGMRCIRFLCALFVANVSTFAITFYDWESLSGDKAAGHLRFNDPFASGNWSLNFSYGDINVIDYVGFIAIPSEDGSFLFLSANSFGVYNPGLNKVRFSTDQKGVVSWSANTFFN